MFKSIVAFIICLIFKVNATPSNPFVVTAITSSVTNRFYDLRAVYGRDISYFLSEEARYITIPVNGIDYIVNLNAILQRVFEQ